MRVHRIEIRAVLMSIAFSRGRERDVRWPLPALPGISALRITGLCDLASVRMDSVDKMTFVAGDIENLRSVVPAVIRGVLPRCRKDVLRH